MALSVEHHTCDQEVVSSSLSQVNGIKSLGKFLTPMCLCHQAVSWYWPKGSDA